MKRILGCILLLAFSLPGSAQSWEIGLTPGVSYYVGDLNPTGHFIFSNPGGGIFGRKNFNYHWSLRFGLNYHRLTAADSISRYDYQQFRNLDFSSHVFEGNVLLELNFFPYKPQELRKYRWTPYLFAGLGLFYYEPETRYNGTLANLSDYGTEGQYLAGNANRPYPPIQPAIPFGMGIKVNISRRLSFGMEYGMRLTFTDYLDDVSTVYPNQQELLLVGGQVATELSNKTPGGDGPIDGFQRGFSKTKDWYGFLGVSLVIALDDPYTCPGYERKPRPWWRKR